MRCIGGELESVSREVNLEMERVELNYLPEALKTRLQLFAKLSQ